jgi:hypothetical protein
MDFPSPIEFPVNYKLGLNQDAIKNKWPNLSLEINFRYTSLKKPGYNCIAYVVGEKNKHVDLLALSKRYDLSQYGLKNTQPFDASTQSYIKLFETFYHFAVCENGDYEKGFQKIVIYEGYDEDGEFGFLHVALQLDETLWTSKLGYLEDIAHTLDGLVGDYYGNPVVFMKREMDITITHFNDEE